ncbi:hypothetical protein SAMN05660461_3420 [Chitinophaga ginsengisegetis]|uniref:Type IX secretion system membrane protein, PorP/SprF family n=1 Tax=Chitinophaga ginsengisegetis TaxID=393003 RepID=A0A1T5P0Z8_9BACT|nr:hypothetical protein [Chitinophaga ginsengisegetis]SKD06420.1 hypothetical protein SAMN05660461_3420 [Chitinophaga ginsengisegetis]
MKQLLLTFLFTWWIALLHAQPLLTPVGKNTGSGSYSRHFQQVISAWYNPAGLSCLSSFAAGIYTENRFMLKDASLYAAIVAVPVHAGAFGGSITRLGNTSWHQQRLSGAYGMRLGRRAGVGLQFNYEATSVQGFGTTGNISFDGGMLWHISEQWHGGVHVYKPAETPVVYSGGVGFEASRDFLLTGEVICTGAFTSVKASAYYRIIRQLALEIGIASGQAYNNAAVILFLRSLRIDIAAGFHPQLGITPSTSLIWQLSPAAME